MTKTVVVVESPAKAKTINKYLGDDYTVLASFGHVRDLPSKNGAVDPDKDFAMDWEISPKGKTHLKDIQDALKGADRLLLATDPDREGEAISWHIVEVMRQRKALVGKDVARIVFYEITPSALKNALAHPRPIDAHLVDAYLARRALDYLVGFSVSPILWRKLPGSRSAGRVQSVALRLIAERENEIEIFVAQEYWSLHVMLETPEGRQFEARVVTVDTIKAGKFHWPHKVAADAILARLKSYPTYTVQDLEKKGQKRHPSPPFTTSTLQQEASRKLGFSVQRTMRTAQKLYEGVKVGAQTQGLITYMRTDSVVMSQDAVAAVRTMIAGKFGPTYVSETPRVYKTKAKNAQEAHEAIRPTDFTLLPEKAAAYLDDDQAKLYTLIWRRAVASQMAAAELELVRADLVSPDGTMGLAANGSTIVFDGFLTLYQEGKDDEDDDAKMLPPLAMGMITQKIDDTAEQHFTQPPPRFTEASLVKRLEELGIGRPSTYASIIQVLLDRGYVELDKKRFVPQGRGRVVTSFLENYFTRYVQYSFTSDLEDKLDTIAEGALPWKQLLGDFWTHLHHDVGEAQKLKISDVLDVLTNALEPFLWPGVDPETNPRLCPQCKKANLSLKVGKFGAFLGCADYPECNYTRQLSGEEGVAALEDGTAPATDGLPRTLGELEGVEITLRRGPYGVYVQMGEGDKKNKPKRASLPPGYDVANFTLTQAQQLLSLPREVAVDPETNEPVLAGIGRFGSYLKVDGKFYSLPKGEDVLTLESSRALELLEIKRQAPPRPPRAGFKKAPGATAKAPATKKRPAAAKTASKKTSSGTPSSPKAPAKKRSPKKSDPVE